MKLMKKSGQILGLVLSSVEKFIKPGLSTGDLDLYAETIIREQGGHPSFKGYRGFPASLCISINEEVVHGIPGDRIIREGDVVTVDCGVTYQGLITDSAITVGVGTITPDAQKLIRTAYKALDKALAIAKPGIRTTELSKVIEETVRKQNFGIVKDLSGHGVGFSLHEDPYILNFYDNVPGPVMKPGMTLAIEPIITMGSPLTKILKDGWTIVTKSGCLAVQVEHTIAITEKGAEILTKRPK